VENSLPPLGLERGREVDEEERGWMEKGKFEKVDFSNFLITVWE